MLKRWFGNGDPAALMAQGKHREAARRLRAELRKSPDNLHLRKLLAEALVGAGETSAAAELLRELANELAENGFLVKAIAVLKRVQRLQPSDAIDSEIDKLLALRQQRAEAPLALPQPVREAAERPTVAFSASPAPAAGAPPAEHGWRTTEIVLADIWTQDTERVDTLRSSPLLGELTAAELSAVVQGMRLLVKRPGALVVSQGESGTALYLLVDGVARVYRRAGEARAEQVGILRAGDFFGALAMLRGEPHGATVIAAETCELLELDRRAFDQLERSFPRLRALIEGGAPSARTDEEITVLAIDSGEFLADTLDEEDAES